MPANTGTSEDLADNRTFTAQLNVGVQTDSARMAEYREQIGLDMSVPDFEVKKIDEAKMGTRLANLLRYFEENSSQGSYSRWITSVLREQNEDFKYVNPEVTKIKLESASKMNNEIIVKFKIWLGENPKKIKQTFVTFHFVDGVSESQIINEIFQLHESVCPGKRTVEQIDILL